MFFCFFLGVILVSRLFVSAVGGGGVTDQVRLHIKGRAPVSSVQIHGNQT